MPPSRSTVAQALARRRALIATTRLPASIDAGDVAAKLAATGRAMAAALANDADHAGDDAVRHLNEVARLSGDGMSVKSIASALGLSNRHVVELRAQLGIGRRR
ncbi:hypothetical protein [Sphingomonas melonis]|uniref:hypothetical protein n=1 Tax=Sphingomonas melonis TaxID=152682 RepID=UPI0035C852F4